MQANARMRTMELVGAWNFNCPWAAWILAICSAVGLPWIWDANCPSWLLFLPTRMPKTSPIRARIAPMPKPQLAGDPNQPDLNPPESIQYREPPAKTVKIADPMMIKCILLRVIK